MTTAAAACLGGMALWPQHMNIWGIMAMAVLVMAGSQGLGVVWAFGIAATGAVALIGGIDIVPYALLTILPGIAMGWMLSRSGTLGKVLTVGLMAGTAGFFINWGWQAWYTSLPLGIHYLEQALADYFDYMVEVIQISGMEEFYADQGFSLQVMKDALAGYLSSLAGLRPAIYLLTDWFRILVGLLLARIALGSRGYLAFPRFSSQRMAWQLDWVIILGLSMWLAGDNWSIEWLQAAGRNLLALMMPIVFYFGMCLTVYLFKRFRKRRLLIAALVMAGLFLPLQFTMVVLILGLFDPLIDYRHLTEERGSSA